VSCPATPTAYTGAPLTPCTATATGAGGLNVAVTPLTYASNTDVGTATANASYAGDANHTGNTGTGSFTIGKAPVVVAVSCPAGPYTYTGAAQTPCAATVTGVGGLSESLTPSYTNNVAAGTATANASYAGDANHLPGSNSGTFTIDKAPSTVAVSCPAIATVYTGAALTPCTATATGAGSLSETLTPTYASNTNVGTATVTASYGGGTNHLPSNGTGSFSISQAPSTVTVTCPAAPTTYTGAAQTPCSATATGAGGLNVAVTPLTYANNTNVGTATANASYGGDANHTGNNGSGAFAIGKAPSVVAVTCPAGPYTYSGAAQTPCTAAVTGVGGLSETLTPTYANNVAAGTATATATYAGGANHLGSTDTGNFTIDKAPSTVAVTCPTTPTVYTGAALAPCTAAVTGAGGLSETLTPTYASNTNVGTATANASFAGGTNHLPSNNSATFAISKASSTVTLTCPATTTYTGAAQTPCTAAATGAGITTPVTVTPVTYTTNTNAGTAGASATWAGDDNHTGSTGTGSFTIGKAPVVVAVSCPAGPYTYTGATQTPCAATVTGVGGLSESLTPTYSSNVAAGTATASASYAGGPNHLPGSNSGTFTIDKAPSTVAVSCPAGPNVYTGSALAPCSATVTGAGGLSETLTPSYADNTNVGTATATASYAGDANHLGSSNSATFAISKAPSTVTVSCPVTATTYTGAALTPCSATATGAGGLNVAVTPLTYASNVNVGTATANASYAGDANHNGSSGNGTFEIARAPATVAVTCPAGPYTYSGAAQTPCTAAVTGAGGLNDVLTPTYTNNVAAGTATANASYSGGPNHLPNSGSNTFTIDKAPSAVAVSCPATAPCRW
jgi:hypothetical protein